MVKVLLRCALGLSLLAIPLLGFAQQGGSMADQSSGSSMSGQAVNATGCLQKGQEQGGYYLTDENGKTWELTGSGLASHVGHKITVTGNTMEGSKSQESKVESDEKAEYGSNQHADLKVTNVKLVSDSCQ